MSFILDKTEILKETKAFYEMLYKKREIIDAYSLYDKLKTINSPKLNNEELNTLEGPLTNTEVLNFSKKNLIFFGKTGSFITRAINQYFEIGSFSEINKLGVITCIQKAGKPKKFLKNWRPITLLNVIYKLASGSIAKRMKTVLDKLINKKQTGFL